MSDIKKAKPEFTHEVLDNNGDYYYQDTYKRKDIITERKSVLDAFVFLKLNWGTTKGYERIKEFINEMDGANDV